MTNILETIDLQLIENSEDVHQKSSKRFFKEEIKSYGVKNPVVNKIAKELFKEVKHLKKEEIFRLCEILFQSGYMEKSLIACHWSYRLKRQYEPKDFELFEKWVDLYIDNWAVCDTFCNHTMGSFLVMYPNYLMRMVRFTESKNRWMRRASAVSLIVPAKKGLFIETIFQIAEILKYDRDDLVQKGLGWMLKCASKPYPHLVFDFIMINKSIMSRTALRYAIEKMSEKMKEEAMERK